MEEDLKGRAVGVAAGLGVGKTLTTIPGVPDLTISDTLLALRH